MRKRLGTLWWQIHQGKRPCVPGLIAWLSQGRLAHAHVKKCRETTPKGTHCLFSHDHALCSFFFSVETQAHAKKTQRRQQSARTTHNGAATADIPASHATQQRQDIGEQRRAPIQADIDEHPNARQQDAGDRRRNDNNGGGGGGHSTQSTRIALVVASGARRSARARDDRTRMASCA
nr:hypothetical protein [Pandoravirus massiliensis]